MQTKKDDLEKNALKIEPKENSFVQFWRWLTQSRYTYWSLDRHNTVKVSYSSKGMEIHLIAKDVPDALKKIERFVKGVRALERKNC